MPFVDISLARGKSPDYLQALSRAVHDALVAELGMKPDDDFQLIHQHEPGEMVFPRDFRGGPRSEDWIVVRITDGLERGAQAKRRFYRALVALLEQAPGISPPDVFVMMTVTPPENFSFADGVSGLDMAAAEALAAAALNPSSRQRYSNAEISYAVTELFERKDYALLEPMLRDDVVMKLPATLPYGGEIHGSGAFADFFKAVPGGGKVWESLESHVDQVIDAGHYLAVQLTNRAVPKATGKQIVFHNLWLFGIAAGQVASAQLYADTAVLARPAPESEH